MYEGVSFDGLREPEGPADQAESVGWRARVTPSDHPVAQFQFNALIGADGKRNTLQVSLSRVPLQGDTSPGKPRLIGLTLIWDTLSMGINGTQLNDL